MKTPPSESSNSASVRSEYIRRQLSQLVDNLEADTRRVNDARFRKLAMKSAEVLENLRTLFERFGAQQQSSGNGKPRAAARGSDDRNGTRPAGSDKKQGQKSRASAAPSPVVGKSDRKSAGKNGKADAGKTAGAAGKDSRVPETVPESSPTPVLPMAAPKPQDPDEIAAKARLQRLAARAPKRPGGQSAPRPVPAQSGKPVWSQPRSS